MSEETTTWKRRWRPPRRGRSARRNASRRRGEARARASRGAAEVLPPKERRARARAAKAAKAAEARSRRRPRSGNADASRSAGARRAAARRAPTGAGQGARGRGDRRGDAAARASAGRPEDPPGHRRLRPRRQDDHGADRHRPPASSLREDRPHLAHAARPRRAQRRPHRRHRDRARGRPLSRSKRWRWSKWWSGPARRSRLRILPGRVLGLGGRCHTPPASLPARFSLANRVRK